MAEGLWRQRAQQAGETVTTRLWPVCQSQIQAQLGQELVEPAEKVALVSSPTADEFAATAAA